MTCLHILGCICPAHLPRGHPGDPVGFSQLLFWPEVVQRVERSQFCLGQIASGQMQY